MRKLVYSEINAQKSFGIAAFTLVYSYLVISRARMKLSKYTLI